MLPASSADFSAVREKHKKWKRERVIGFLLDYKRQTLMPWAARDGTSSMHLTSVTTPPGNSFWTKSVVGRSLNWRWLTAATMAAALGKSSHATRSNTVFVMGFHGVSNRVVHNDTRAIRLEFAHDIDDLRVSQVRAILLEGQSQHDDWAVLDRMPVPHQLLDGLLGDELAHAVIDPATGEDDLGVVAEFLCLVR